MKIFNIKIEVSWTWGLLVLFIALQMPAYNLVGLLATIMLMGLSFFTILGHELSHALVAKKFGCRVPLIKMHALGGMAFIENLGKLPLKKDAIISAAGPMFNFTVALILYTLFLLPYFNPILVNAADTIIWFNFLIGTFNLAPFYPLDGGRIYKYFLTFFVSEYKAETYTHITGTIGGILFAILGVITVNPILVLVALFVLFTNYTEMQKLI